MMPRNLSQFLTNLQNINCEPRKNIPFPLYRINQRVQEADETYDQYRTALRKLAESWVCEYWWNIAWQANIWNSWRQSLWQAFAWIPANFTGSRWNLAGSRKYHSSNERGWTHGKSIYPQQKPMVTKRDPITQKQRLSVPGNKILWKPWLNTQSQKVHGSWQNMKREWQGQSFCSRVPQPIPAREGKPAGPS